METIERIDVYETFRLSTGHVKMALQEHFFNNNGSTTKFTDVKQLGKKLLTFEHRTSSRDERKEGETLRLWCCLLANEPVGRTPPGTQLNVSFSIN